MTCPPFCQQCGGNLGHPANGDWICRNCRKEEKVTHQPKLAELAERCEAATGPDRELDCAIAVALNRTDEGGSGFHRVFADDSVFEQVRAQLFTASLDAAMTLVPKDWRRSNLYEAEPQNKSSRGWLEYATLQRRTGGSHVMGTGAIPALALTAAALRARAAMEERK